jgi:hypothetical protein
MSDFDLIWQYLRARFRMPPNSEDGMTTTEVAVITFLLVGAAILVLGIIVAAAKGNADNIPNPQQPS